jgi:hypothetical protein
MSVDATFTAELVTVPTKFTSAYGSESTRIHEPAVILTSSDGQAHGMPRATFDALYPNAGLNPDTMEFDDTLLTFVSVVPADEAVDQLASVNIVLTFSNPIRPATVDATTIVVTADAVAKEGAFTVEDEVVTFNPTDDFAASDVVAVTVTTSVADLFGHVLAEEVVVGFTVAA